tara:strand:+ start:523 stop:924 length:402 start_codon:yes stop_codon:yes gene_type:complete
MSKKNTDTAEILKAIKNMMSNNETNTPQDLPQDVLKLTESIEDKKKYSSDDVLELTEIVSESVNRKGNANDTDKNESIDMIIDEKMVRTLVRDAISSLSSSRIDEIINEELKKVIKDKLDSSKIIISSKNNVK